MGLTLLFLFHRNRNLTAVNNLLSCEASLSSYLLTPILLPPPFFPVALSKKEWNLKLKLSN